MDHNLAALAVLASLTLSTAGAVTGLVPAEQAPPLSPGPDEAPAVLSAGEDPGDNGIVYMVHGTFEPNPTAPTPAPPAHEAFATTQQSGQIVLHVIPYSVEDQAPTSFEDDVQITLEGPAPDQSVVVEPRAGTSDDERCVDETSIKGHQGDVEDCLVVEIDAETVQGWGLVEIVLEGTHAPTGTSIAETYSSPAHVAMHTTMEDGQPGWSTADQLSTVGTPILVEDLVDPAA